jgi:hypothetical protein
VERSRLWLATNLLILLMLLPAQPGVLKRIAADAAAEAATREPLTQ